MHQEVVLEAEWIAPAEDKKWGFCREENSMGKDMEIV